MAYFLPSYFQKRLLRYALSRLDFIESDALDLDNLGVTIGQRSVIDLKNVGIKVSKLAEKAPLPPAVTLKSATIQTLRITIPADLHISGIEIDIDGVDFDVKFDHPKQEEEVDTRSQRGHALNRKDIANKPRKGSTSTYDPGGRSSTRSRHDLSSSYILPNTDDLAASFLEAEPEVERWQLRAAVESRSAYLTKSTLSVASSEEEAGVGEAFSLPGFVANFFAGVADRLSVTLRRISLAITMIEEENGNNGDFSRFVVDVDSLRFSSLNIVDLGLDGQGGKRSIVLEGLTVSIECSTFGTSVNSAVSSPQLAKASSNISRKMMTGSDIEMTQKSTASATSLPVSGLFGQASDTGLALTDSVLLPYQPAQTTSKTHLLDSSASLSRGPSSQASSTDDLAESKLFDHDLAASMYMSAMSEARSVAHHPPGAWASPNLSSAMTESISPADGSFSLDLANTPHPPETAPGEGVVHATATADGRDVSINSSQMKTFLQLDRLEIKLPQRVAGGVVLNSDSSIYPKTRITGTTSRLQDDFSSSRIGASHHRSSSAQATHEALENQDMLVNKGEVCQVRFVSLQCFVDMTLCHALVKIVPLVMQSLSTKPTNAHEASDITDKDRFSIEINVNSVDILVLENTTVESRQKFNHSTRMGADTPLLQLSIADIKFESVATQGSVNQRLSCRTFSLSKGGRCVVMFLDDAGTQASMMTSTIILSRHDIVMKRFGQHIDINTKPIFITLDLVSLDDVLSRSGGLESFLDLAASMNSNGTMKSSRQPSRPPNRQRSVRFDETKLRRGQGNAIDQAPKINMRVNAVTLELIGSESSLQLNTSALKLVYRSSKLRTSISSISLKGPYVAGHEIREMLQIRLSNVEFVFLEVPEDSDLERLLGILAPSSEKSEENDEIMVDTLLRQRQKGSVMRSSVQEIHVISSSITWLPHILSLADEIAKLSAVTKYLPDDDKPGILIFILVKNLHVLVEFGDAFGQLDLHSKLLEGALISSPSLVSLQISIFNVQRNTSESIVRELIHGSEDHALMVPHMLTFRFIPEEMEPTLKLRLVNTCVEYTVPLLIAVTTLVEDISTALKETPSYNSPQASDLSAVSGNASDVSRKVRFSLNLKSSAILLRPLNMPAAGFLLFTDASLNHSSKSQHVSIAFEIKKGSLLIIDDFAKTGREATNADAKLYFDQNDQVQELAKLGFVPVGSISSASIDVKIIDDKTLRQSFVDVEFRNNLFYLETCADSTQTLGQIFGGLSRPPSPSKDVRYRTEIIPIDDMLASFTGAAFVAEPGPESGLQASKLATSISDLGRDDLTMNSAEIVDENADSVESGDHVEIDQRNEEYHEIESTESAPQNSLHIAPVSMISDSSMQSSVMIHSMIDLRDDHFQRKTFVGGTAHRWDARHGTYGLGNEALEQKSPLKVRVRDVHIIWNLFDGYDWQNTRDVISQAVRDIEDKAYVKQNRKGSRRSPAPEEEDESVIGDVLFNSIYISIPTNKDPRDLVNAINMELGDTASETGSYATSTTITATTSRRQANLRPTSKKLRLNRSKQHKMTFELEGVSADFLKFPPGTGEIDNSIDIRVRKLEIFDHVPTSTWKKFATYMQEAGEREVGTDMIHVEILNVKPVADLTASEMVLKLTVLPLRLHVDQDALDFLTRFFEFKDDRVPPSGVSSAPPFIQRAEVNPIRVRLDFKPKRVDYAALKSGRTTELMNFIVLDRSDMVLRRVILYGVSGLDRLGIMLNNIWTPDVRNNQLSGVLAGLAPVRSLVDVGSGVRDLIAVPIREYRKDGRLVRSIQRGAIAFAKTTTTELVNLGAKLAIGTQQILQNTEEVLASQRSEHNADEDGSDVHRQISLYADQPLGIVQGLRGAYASLERDLLLAKDAIVAVPGEIMANPSAAGAAKVVLKQAPTIILRPAIGVTKAAGQAFLGAGNTLDKGNRKRIEDKYKRY